MMPQKWFLFLLYIGGGCATVPLNWFQWLAVSKYGVYSLFTLLLCCYLQSYIQVTISCCFNCLACVLYGCYDRYLTWNRSSWWLVGCRYVACRARFKHVYGEMLLPHHSPIRSKGGCITGKWIKHGLVATLPRKFLTKKALFVTTTLFLIQASSKKNSILKHELFLRLLDITTM